MGTHSPKALFAVPLTLVAKSAAVLLLLGLLVFTSSYVLRFSSLYDEALQELKLEMTVHATSLNTHLDKYRGLTVLASHSPEIRDALTKPGNQADIESRVRFLSAVSGVQGYALVSNDQVIVANDRLPESVFSTPSDNVRAGISAALQGRLGRAHETYGRNNDTVYLFFAPVFDNYQVVGMVSSLVDLQEVVNNWGLSKTAVAAWDTQGQRVLSNVDIWPDLTEDKHGLMSVFSEAVEKSINFNTRLHSQMTLPILKWTLTVQRSLRAQRVNALTFAAFITSIFTVLMVMLSAGVFRRRLLMARVQEREALAKQLEDKVEERTHSLSDANKQLKEAQERLVNSGKLTLLGQMSASISHELSQPLGAIKTYASNTERMLSRGMSEEATKNLRTIGEVVDRASRIIGTLRSFSSNQKVEFRETGLVSVIDNSCAEFLVRMPAAHQFINVAHQDSLLIAWGGEVRLLQVLHNLLNNAWLSCHELDAPEISVESYRDAQYANIVVSDNGPAIPPEVQDDIFDAFVSTRAHKESMGLGLTISRSFIESMGGTLNYAEADTGGATFTISLKLAG